MRAVPAKVFVVGLGHPDRGDDAVGARVARQLRDRLPSDVMVTARRGDVLALIEEWAECDAVVCIDAAAPMGEPGRIHRIDLATEDLPPDISVASSHMLGLPEAIKLARTLGMAPAHIIVYAIEGRCFETGGALTPAVAIAADVATDRIVIEVAGLQNMTPEVCPHA